MMWPKKPQPELLLHYLKRICTIRFNICEQIITNKGPCSPYYWDFRLPHVTYIGSLAKNNLLWISSFIRTLNKLLKKFKKFQISNKILDNLTSTV